MHKEYAEKEEARKQLMQAQEKVDDLEATERALKHAETERDAARKALACTKVGT